MLNAVYVVVVCLCVCVCVSVTLRYCIKLAKRRITQITPHDSPMTSFMMPKIKCPVVRFAERAKQTQAVSNLVCFIKYTSYISQDIMDCFTIFSPNGWSLVADCISDILFIPRDVAIATNFAAKFADQPSFGTMAFRNGLKYRNTNERFGSADYPSTSSTNLVNFNSITHKIMTVKITTFWRCWKYRYIPVNISESIGVIYTK